MYTFDFDTGCAASKQKSRSMVTHERADDNRSSRRAERIKVALVGPYCNARASPMPDDAPVIHITYKVMRAREKQLRCIHRLITNAIGTSAPSLSWNQRPVHHARCRAKRSQGLHQRRVLPRPKPPVMQQIWLLAPYRSSTLATVCFRLCQLSAASCVVTYRAASNTLWDCLVLVYLCFQLNAAKRTCSSSHKVCRKN